MIDAIHILGQILFGGFFIYNGIKHFSSYRDYVMFAEVNEVPAPKAAVAGTGILLLLGGLGVLFNFYAYIALILLIIFLVPTTLIMHAFWKSENPGERSAQKIQFLKNTALLGAVLLMF